MVNTEAIIRHALQEAIPITLVVNKIDRLILELRLPPADAFYKIKHTIEDINTYIRSVYSTHFQTTTELVTVALTQVRIFV
jgi:U5 small nuclear ribonucleoprotein component